MTRSNSKRLQRSSKKTDKKQIRKKQAVLVQRCIQALNSNADSFRAKFTDPEPSRTTKSADGSLKHFKPIRIETVDKSTISDTVDMLENKFSIENQPKKEECPP